MATTDLCEGQLERRRLEQELEKLRLVHPFPTEIGIATHRRQIAELEARIDALPALPEEPLDPRTLIM